MVSSSSEARLWSRPAQNRDEGAEQHHPHFGCESLQYCQLSLFHFDPWGGGPDPIVWLNHPAPGIARAVFAPVWAGFGYVESLVDAYFFAVTEDGWNVQQGKFKNSGIVLAPDGLNSYLLKSNVVKSDSDPDCMESWLNVKRFEVSATGKCQSAIISLARVRYGLEGFSIDEKLLNPLDRQLAYERHIVATINEKIESAIAWALQSLRPKVLEVLTLRPRLSLSTARALFERAESDAKANHYVAQALKTESVALLNLLVNGDPKVADPLVQTLLSGGSLPRALLDIGISKAMHRRSLWSERPEGGHFLLANIPMTGDQYLRSQQALKLFPIEKWPKSEVEWSSFIGMIDAIPPCLSQSATNRLMQFCWRSRVGAAKRISELVEATIHLRDASRRFGKHVPLEEAVDAIVSTHPNDKSVSEQEFQFHVIAKNRPGVLAVRLAFLTGLTVKTMASELLLHLPEIKDGFHDGFRFHGLCTLEEFADHAKATNNCLGEAAHVMSYIPHGVTVFSVTSLEANAIVGTLALKAVTAFFYRGVTFEKYHFEYVCEETVVEPPPVFEKAITEYIRALNGRNNKEWLLFVKACEAWRNKGGISIDS